MAREVSLANLAATHGLQQLSMADLVAYREFEATLSIQEGVTVHLPTRYGDLTLTEYQTGQAEPALLLRSQQSVSEPPLVRVHSECLTGMRLGPIVVIVARNYKLDWPWSPKMVGPFCI